MKCSHFAERAGGDAPRGKDADEEHRQVLHNYIDLFQPNPVILDTTVDFHVKVCFGATFNMLSIWNLFRETPTSAGPNSFNKGKQGFSDNQKLWERKLKAHTDK